MKITSRILTIAACATALLLVAGLLGFREVRRQNAVKSTRFAQQYTHVIQQLREKVDSVQKKMKRNETLIPTVVVGGRLGALVQQVIDKNHPLVLQGIAWSEDQPLVMLDDKNFKPGDQIGGYTVLQIFPQSIVVKNVNGEQQEIMLFKADKP